ncbi:MAG: universal stress protein, partial [Burkholderiales bacterium]|nr:universal stress protein [Burkholderiales bacterium]
QVPKGIDVDGVVALGTIYDEIVKMAKQISADLIVMASHRPGLQDYLIGPNATRVIR